MEGENIKGEAVPLDSGMPTEAFACPACGQMLAPTVRVCVACKTPVDFSKIHKPAPAEAEGESEVEVKVTAPPQPVVKERARFSWSIFFVTLVIWLFMVSIVERFLSPLKSQIVMGSIVILTSGWVFFDAQGKGIPRPLRWGIGSLLLWIVIFPWYLSRRRTPEASCPFVEAEAKPMARVLFFVLVVFFLLGAILLLFKGPHG